MTFLAISKQFFDMKYFASDLRDSTEKWQLLCHVVCSFLYHIRRLLFVSKDFNLTFQNIENNDCNFKFSFSTRVSTIQEYLLV
jgi:hypothetical protein